MIINSNKTIYCRKLETAMLLGVPYKALANTTLNEKFNILVNNKPINYPTLKYYAIGVGGNDIIEGNVGYTYSEHNSTHATLFNHVPFILREITNDISATERAKYGLRRKEIFNGVTYIAYYLKRLPLSNVVPDMEYITVNDGVQTVNVFSPNSSNLNPTPPDLSNTGVNLVSGDYVAASAKMNIDLSSSDVAELLNVANVMYGDSSYAIISEIALCTGVDKTVQSPGANNSMINFNEAIAVQVASFINTFYALEFTNSGAEIALDIGICEPLLKLGQ